MSDSTDKLSIVWEDLKYGIDEIFHLSSLTRKNYINLYTCVYNYCTFLDPNSRLSVGKGEAVGSNKLVGLELYKKLREYLKQHVASLKSKGDNLAGDELLSFFEKAWRDFRFSACVLNGVFAYLNRNWVKREFEEGRKNVFVVYALAVVTWRDVLFRPHSRALISSIFREIERERHGEDITTSRLQTIIGCLVELRVTTNEHVTQHAHDSAHTQKSPVSIPTLAQPSSGRPVTVLGHVLSTPPATQLDFGNAATDPQASATAAASSALTTGHRAELTIYQDYLERPFLQETKRFYSWESTEYLQANSVTDFLKRAELRLKEERNRAHAYLHISTLPDLLRTCEQSLIGDHIERITADLPGLLNDEQMDDIARMYRLVGRFEEGRKIMISITEAHVDEVGSSAIKKISESAMSDPKLFVDTIIQVHKRNTNLVSVGFSMDQQFSQALDKGSERFINRNAITEAAGSPRKCPELLAKYVDSLLKKGAKESQTDDLEETFNRIMEIFKYMEDKDVFQKFYSNMLARRLVNNMSISDDTEASMISRLKCACGFEYTAKLQRMFQDVGSSRDLNSKFYEYLSGLPPSQTIPRGLDFGIMVLSSNAWPFQSSGAFSIPKELESCFQIFNTFYQKHHSGRKLTWCHHLSRGDVVTLYTKSRFTFQLSTYQMSVLMLYNADLIHSISSIQSSTGIELPTLLQVLQILLKARVLKLADPENSAVEVPPKRHNDDDANEPPLSPDSRLRLYTDYNNKRLRVNLNLPVKSEAKQETEHTLVNVESDRKLIVQACIVRIMKTRKSMLHNLLINEVISQLSSRFRPAIPLIKHCLNSLIEREFVKRAPNSRDTYEYIA